MAKTHRLADPRRAVWLAMIGVGLILALAADRIAGNRHEAQFPAVGLIAPAFTLPDARQPDQGISLDTFRGRPTVLVFYASWCAECAYELGKLARAGGAFGDSLAIVAVNVQEAPARARNALDEAGATFPAVLDADARIARRYGLRGVPGTYFIRPDGRLAAFGAGGIDEGTLWSEIESLGLQPYR